MKNETKEFLQWLEDGGFFILSIPCYDGPRQYHQFYGPAAIFGIVELWQGDGGVEMNVFNFDFMMRA